ncbi:unnamed protein product, partial [Adineta ricciae]
EEVHKTWTEGIEKVRCVVSNAEQLVGRLHIDIKQFTSRWPLDEKSVRKALTDDAQWYHLFLYVICNHSLYTDDSRAKMFQACRNYYPKVAHQIKQIDKLEEEYKPCNAIREYTKDSFLYRIVNRALRIQDMQIITEFAPYIHDLHAQLYQLHEKYYLSSKQTIRSVYRGQALSLDELNYLKSICQSRRPIIILTSFISTTLDPGLALGFASAEHDQIPCLFEIIITNEYNNEHQHTPAHEQVFANISQYSAMGEKEVLFSLVSHFRVERVDYPVDGCRAMVTLELISDRQGACTQNYFQIADTISKETNPQVFGDVLHILKENAADELQSETTNWKQWWSRLSSKWGTRETDNRPLHLIMYSCFTDNPDWSRKAIEMNKAILRAESEIEANRSSFSYLFKRFNSLRPMPTECLALFEEYLEPLCKTNSNEVYECLCSAGYTYNNISDKENALKCFEKASSIKRMPEIQNQIKHLKKPPKQSKPSQSREVVQMKQDYTKLPIRKRLDHLLEYLRQRQRWYDAADAKILFRRSENSRDGLSVNDYRCYSLSAMKRH